MSNHPLTHTETSEQRAAGAGVIDEPRSVFDTVADLQVYKDRWEQRCRMYALRRAYYRGDVYAKMPDHVVALQLYSGIRQIYSPLRKAVRIDTAKIPGAWRMPDEGEQPVPEGHRLAVKTWRERAHADAIYAKAVQHGAVAGELGLMLHLDTKAGTLEPVALRPDEVITGDLADGQPFGLVIKPGVVDRGGHYEYAQLFTPSTIRTYRNGIAHDYDGGGPERPNVLQFVPLILAPFIIGEDGTGECSFSGVQEQLDRVNDGASQALDVVGRNSEPWLVLSGVNKNEVEIDETNNAIVLDSADAKAYTVAPNLAIADALALIQDVKAELKSNLPQLIFDDLKTRNDLAYDSIVTLCSELIDHVHDARRNVDAAIVTLERWAITAAKQLAGHPLAGLIPEQHRIDPDRPVIEPTPGQKLEIEQKRIGVEQARYNLDNPAPKPAPGGPR